MQDVEPMFCKLISPKSTKINLSHSKNELGFRCLELFIFLGKMWKLVRKHQTAAARYVSIWSSAVFCEPFAILSSEHVGAPLCAFPHACKVCVWRLGQADIRYIFSSPADATFCKTVLPISVLCGCKLNQNFANKLFSSKLQTRSTCVFKHTRLKKRPRFKC